MVYKAYAYDAILLCSLVFVYTMHHIHNAPCEMTFPDFNYAQESLVSIAAHS
jgi:hypothetical protein